MRPERDQIHETSTEEQPNQLDRTCHLMSDKNKVDPALGDVVNDEEEDEDVKEAKASIKCHLDRVKETELFLESLKKDEENYERERQQMLLFNDLMLGTKFNALRSFRGARCDMMPAQECPIIGDSSYYRASSGLRSAPIRSYCGNNGTIASEQQQTNGFLLNHQESSSPSSAALSFEPTYVLPTAAHAQRSSCNIAQSYIGEPGGPPTTMMHSTLTDSQTYPTTACDPFLEPVSPVLGAASFRYSGQLHDSSGKFQQQPAAVQTSSDWRRFRRSRSQLGDQFNDFNSRRSMAAETGTILGNNKFNDGYPASGARAKRSLSQLRYSSNRLSQPVAMSEYMSAYGDPSSGAQPFGRRALSPASPDAPEVLVSSRLTGNSENGDDDDDDGMSAYRAASYVPKVVPAGTTITRGRSHEKRRSYMTTTTTTTAAAGGKDDRTAAIAERQPRRRTSLQMYSSSRTVEPPAELASESSPVGRRRSLTTIARDDESSQLQKQSRQVGSAENFSRLSELEQRIKENKRRREELLAGRSSPDPKVVGRDPDTTNKENVTSSRARRESSPATSSATPTTTGRIARPSRLESMEARIKRKSYCVRVGDCSPERAHSFGRGQVSLEKWRQSNHQPSGESGGGSCSSQGRVDSALMASSNLLLSRISTKSHSSSNAPDSKANEED